MKLEDVKTIEELAKYIQANPDNWKDDVYSWLNHMGWRNLIGSGNRVCIHDDKLLYFIPNQGVRIVDCSMRLQIGSKLKKERIKAGYSYAKFSMMTGVSTPNIVKIENGSYNPSLDILSKMLTPLGLKLELVVDEKKKKKW